MSKTRTNRAAHLLVTVALLVTTIAAPPHVTAARGVQPAAPTKHNGKIVFISDRHYKGISIWTMNPDGSSPTRLTDDNTRTEKLPNFSPVYDTSPVWSPDGTKIAFISNRDYLLSLYVMNADGSNAQLVTNKPLEPSRPAWSPDGRKIAFSAGLSGTFGTTKPAVDIYVINVDGSGLTKLTDGGVNGGAAWSPDGKQIAFASNRGAENTSRIWLMNADGSNQRILPNSGNTDGTGFMGGEPAWSPDGTKILFTSYRACGSLAALAVYVTNADGSNSRLLTNDPNVCGSYGSPRWSPDGTRILASFSLKTGGVTEPAQQIVIMNADGTNQISVSNRARYGFNSGQSSFIDAQADWQPVAAPLDFASSVIGFSAPSYTMNEDVGKSMAIPVTRTGKIEDVASCSWVILTSNPEVRHSNGTLRFAAGESSKTIPVAVPDIGGKLNWSYRIVLSDNEGNATFLGGIKEAAITILGRNAAPPGTNPN